MDLSNKKIAFLGDSITFGVGASDPEKKYVSVFSEITNSRVLNFGINGTRFAPQTRLSNDPFADRDFISRVPELPEDIDAIVVFGGTNDFGHGDAPFGSLPDTEPATFCGACDRLMRLLIEKYPSKPIVFMTPLHRLTEEDLINEIGLKRKSLAEYVDVIRKKAEKYSVPVLDLFASGGMQPNIEAQNKLYFADGLHPNDAGHRRIAEKLKSFMERNI